MCVEGKKIKSIKKLKGLRNVYCLGSENNGTMIANGIITKNCDALRYCLFTAFGKKFSMDITKTVPKDPKPMVDLRDYGFR